MRRIDELFARYGESHRNPRNKAIHWVCVPLIMWSVLSLLWSWTPFAAYALILVALAYYVTLSPTIAVGMLAVTAAFVYPLTLLGSYALIAAVVVFVVAWIGQFIGHHIEGRKPSFVEDVRFFLIGPAWLLGDLYRKLGIAY